MTETDADNEVARAIIRRRDRFYVLPYSPFEDCWHAFSDGVDTYYIAREGYGFHTGDHWQDHHDYFRPAPHLMATIRDLVRAAEERQSASRHHSKAMEMPVADHPMTPAPHIPGAEIAAVTIDPKTLDAAIRCDLWASDMHAIVDAVCATSDAGDLSTEQCIALGVLLAREAIAARIVPPPNTDLIKRLRTVSNMINMGEKIAWASETMLMDEAADALAALANVPPQVNEAVPVKIDPHARKVAEPVVPQSVIDAFARRYSSHFDLERDDHEWRNTWRYKHEHIQSIWEGWRDGYIALASPSPGTATAGASDEAAATNPLHKLLDYLRARSKGRGHLSVHGADVLIEPLLDAMIEQSMVERLETALRPFAEFVPDFFDDGYHDDDIVSITSHHGGLDLTLTVGDFRRTAQALGDRS